MDRNAVAPDSAEGSFAGLLEHFTRRSGPETQHQESGPNTASRIGSSTRFGTRTLAPATELKAGRGSAVEDSTPLSYEQALRLHARRRTPANVNLDLPNIPLSAVPSHREATPDPRQERTRNPKARDKASTSPLSASSTQPAPELPRRKPAPKSSSPQSKVQATARAKKSSPKKSSPGRQRRADSPHSAPRASSSLHPAMLSEAISEARRKPQPPSNARPASSNRRSALSHTASSRSAVKAAAFESITQPAGAKSLAKVERRDLQWSPAGPLDLLSQTAQKRTIVSLRMTDIEFLQLKDRAGESGVSISAYMRSCILDADQLRTQVKQALAEMRALSAMPDPNRFPALASPDNRRLANGGDWFGMLWRSAAFLLSPLFSFRRSA